MSRVFVLNPDRTPLMPCTPKRARKLMDAGRAAIFRRYPFTIILKETSKTACQPLTLKIDPGSRTTGLALVMEGQTGLKCVWGAELTYRGGLIHETMTKRRGLRSGRRSRKLRHRPARFLNRTKPAGWLPPSLMHRVLTTMTWVRKIDRWTPMDSVAIEMVSFDTQKMQNPLIRGKAYQRGTLYGTEVRAYLMHRWAGKCAYCGERGGLEVEHLVPRSRGGSSRISNLVMSCQDCNQSKGTQTVENFLQGDPARLKTIQAQQQASLADSAAVNATKYRLRDELLKLGYPVEEGTGAQTSWNRMAQNYLKAHWIDAICVGIKGEKVDFTGVRPLLMTSMGHGTRQRCLKNTRGIPIAIKAKVRIVHGFQTGDLCRAVIVRGKYAGTQVGRIAVRANGQFKINRIDANWKVFTRLARVDGYAYGH